MTKSMKIHDSAIERFERAIQEEQDRLAQEFILSLQTRMGELNMSQSDMAFTLGKSRAYVSKLFTKEQNLTIKTMVELAHSLDMKMAISVRALWLETMPTSKLMPLQYKDWSKERTISCAPMKARIAGTKAEYRNVAWNDLAQESESPLLQHTS